jgi:hypothetical protein
VFVVRFGFNPDNIMTYTAKTHTEKKKNKKILKAIVKWMIFLSVIILILMIIVPWLPICGHCKKPCAEFEYDARTIAAAIFDYFADPDHTNIDISSSDLEGVEHIENQWTIFASGDEIHIQVFDTEGKCPVDYQNDNPGWNSNIYTYRLELGGD